MSRKALLLVLFLAASAASWAVNLNEGTDAGAFRKVGGTVTGSSTFSTTVTVNGSATVAGITSSHPATFSDNIRAATASVTGNLTVGGTAVIPTGGSIQGASQVASYATGVWTPRVVAYNAVQGYADLFATYTNQKGTYITIGNMVFANFYLSTSVKSAATGTVYVDGFPFNASATTAIYSFCKPFSSGITASNTFLAATSATNTWLLYSLGLDGTTTSVTDGSCSAFIGIGGMAAYVKP